VGPGFRTMNPQDEVFGFAAIDQSKDLGFFFQFLDARRIK
jgi:hypothetical protein